MSLFKWKKKDDEGEATPIDTAKPFGNPLQYYPNMDAAFNAAREAHMRLIEERSRELSIRAQQEAMRYGRFMYGINHEGSIIRYAEEEVSRMQGLSEPAEKVNHNPNTAFQRKKRRCL